MAAAILASTGSRLHERGAQKSQRWLEILGDELGIEPKHAIASAPERFISTLVNAAASRVISAVDFNDKPRGWRVEIDDVATERHLAAERDAELLAAKLLETAFPRSKLAQRASRERAAR